MAHQHSARFLRIVEDAKEAGPRSSIDDVKARLDRGDKFVLVDVREESEYAKDHLPGAIHLGKGIIERDIEERVPEPSTPIVLYCGGGFRSALAADNLQKMGYAQRALHGRRHSGLAREEFSLELLTAASATHNRASRFPSSILRMHNIGEVPP